MSAGADRPLVTRRPAPRGPKTWAPLRYKPWEQLGAGHRLPDQDEQAYKSRMPRPYTNVKTNTCEWEEPDFPGTAAAKPGAGAHMAGATRHWAPGEAGSPREGKSHLWPS